MGTKYKTESISLVSGTDLTLVKSFTHAKGGIVKITIPKGLQTKEVKLVVDNEIAYEGGVELFILDRIQDNSSSWAITAGVVEVPFDSGFEFYIINTWASTVLFQYYLNK